MTSPPSPTACPAPVPCLPLPIPAAVPRSLLFPLRSVSSPGAWRGRGKEQREGNQTSAPTRQAAKHGASAAALRGWWALSSLSLPQLHPPFLPLGCWKNSRSQGCSHCYSPIFPQTTRSVLLARWAGGRYWIQLVDLSCPRMPGCTTGT